MSLASVTHESLTTQFGTEVPEVFVVVAKHRVAGIDTESIAEVIGCDVKDVEEVESHELYKQVRQVIGAMAAASQADQGFLWDSIEEKAARRLLERMEVERDPEFLLKAAATANRMTRRTQVQKGNVLDPSMGGQRAAVTLTRRMVEKITAQGHRQVMEEQQLSIHDGSMSSPSFEEVDQLFGISRDSQAHVTKRLSPIDDSDNLSLEHLDKKMQDR